MRSYEILEKMIDEISDVKMVYITSESEIYDEFRNQAIIKGDIEPHSTYLILEDRLIDDDEPDAIAWDGDTYMLYLVEE